jgi:iron complex transport system ATP-binding protein
LVCDDGTLLWAQGLEQPMAELVLKDVGAGYGAQSILHGVSLTLRSGGLAAVLGPNGAGKTTLLRALTGFLPLRRGSVQWRGPDGATAELARLTPRERARYIAYVPQLADEAASLSVHEALLIAARANAAAPATVRSRAAEALDALGLAGLAQARCAALSGGQWRRVLLAQGLAQAAPVLLLDEPTAFLDPPGRYELLELLAGLAAARDLCVVSVLHDPLLAAQFAAQAVTLKAGRVFADGAPAEVIVPERLTALYGSASGWERQLAGGAHA